ncbi:MAG: SMC family ATPase [Chloroflexi bacterium]|nr:SMC family ATPase [Chloroflexota bacterium]
MIPINLTLSGFLSYRDPVEIDFTSFDLACIAGRNGAGKSSLLDAITWALFGQARKRDDSIINAQSEAAEVGLTFEYEGNIYRVVRAKRRDKATVLEFHIAQNRGQRTEGRGQKIEGRGQRTEGREQRIVGRVQKVEGDLSSALCPLPSVLSPPPSVLWKPLTEHTMRATQACIEETLRLDYETFVNAAFFLQGKADQFTQQRPGDRKRILANILGLEIWETYRQRTAKHRKDVEAEIAALDGRLGEINAELAEEKTRKTRLAELETDLDRLAQTRAVQESALENIRQIAATLAEQRKLVDTLARQLDSSRQRMSELDLRAAARQMEKESYAQNLSHSREIEAAYQALQGARVELAHWEGVAEQFREHEKRRAGPRTTIESERARLTQELEMLQEQESGIRDQGSGISNLQSLISNLQSLISNLQSQLETRTSLETELGVARDRLANAKAENPRLKAEMDELKARIDQLTETDGAAPPKDTPEDRRDFAGTACPLCGQPLSADERQSLIDDLTTVGKAMGDKYRANRILLAESDQLVSNLQSQISNLQSLDEDLRTHTRSLDQLTAQVQQIEADQQTWMAEGQPRLEALIFTLQHETFTPEARAILAEIDAELKATGYDAAAHDAVRRAAANSAAETEFLTLGRAQAALAPIEDEIANLQSQISNLKSEISNQQPEYDAASASLAAAEASAPDIRRAQRDLFDLQEQENRLRMQVGAAQQKVLVLGGLKSRRKSLEAERETQAGKVGQYKQLERAFGKDGVPALLIEQALPQIETKANEILERLSGGNMSVRFLTQREYKDNRREDLRETLDIQISDAAGMRDYEMFSGGEAFRVNFAIRLALSEVLAQRAGARLQTLVIDEGFGSQDAVGRQSLIEAINTIKPDFAKILVITHIDELKDAFPTRIEVEKTPRGSVIQVI